MNVVNVFRARVDEHLKSLYTECLKFEKLSYSDFYHVIRIFRFNHIEDASEHHEFHFSI